ncbi:MAG TPA: polynucleotide adenylyltransferase PcnB [Spirochaetales bacterium]|nr:polynucleotide adenylyltransferase PcnB [Spirochaetales bacterium]
MLIRYHTGPDGKPVKKAVVYTRNEHGIQPRSVDQDAVRIVERLRQNGHDAYIVGGAVRDLLVGRVPKDYDIVTDAEPSRIKRLFYRSRIIGKRFRLVHVYVGQRIYEVSTFRSISNGTVGNTYGTIDEDARRRDFSMNALYFDPTEGIIVDYVNGLKDIKARRVMPVIPLATIFSEDPVRMIRAVKYACATGFSIPLLTRMAIRRNAAALASASVSRLGEEAIKILGSGHAGAIIDMLHAYKLLAYILPEVGTALADKGAEADKLREALRSLDDHVRSAGDKTLGTLLSFLVKLPVDKAAALPAPDVQTAARNAMDAARAFLSPLTLPRVELEAAVASVFVAPEFPARVRKARKRKRRKPGSRTDAQDAAAPDGEAAEAAESGTDGRATDQGGNGPDRQTGTSASARRRKRRRKAAAKRSDGAQDGSAPGQ